MLIANLHVSTEGYYCETCGAAPGELHLSKCLEKIPTEIADLRNYCPQCDLFAGEHFNTCTKYVYTNSVQKVCTCDLHMVLLPLGCQCGGT